MSVTVDATVGGASANSYLTVADADTILNLRLGIGSWTDASTDDKGRALIMATRDIDTNRFLGERVSYSQILEWPRTYQREPADQIPRDVQFATAEQALWILQNSASGGRSDRQQLAAQGVTSYTVGNLSETLSSTIRNGGLSSEASRYLTGYLKARTGRLIGPREQAKYDFTDTRWRTGPFAP